MLALDTLGDRDRALRLLRDMQHLRCADGAYWTGYVYADEVVWPRQKTTYTAAAVVLAVDALSHTTTGSDIFRGSSLRFEKQRGHGTELVLIGTGMDADAVLTGLHDCTREPADENAMLGVLKYIV